MKIRFYYLLWVCLIFSCSDDDEENKPPVASDVNVLGELLSEGVVRGSYRYADAEGDTESKSTFRWYISSNEEGIGAAQIARATSDSYMIPEDKSGKYIAFEVTPRQEDGQKGVPVRSGFVEIKSNIEITLYEVVNGNLKKKKDYAVVKNLQVYQQDEAAHLALWNRVREIIPTEELWMLKEFMVYDGEADGTWGYVMLLNKELTEWQMGLDVDYAYNGNTFGLDYTIIHEFGHLYTLNGEQIDSFTSEEACLNYFTGFEGCSHTDSYLNQMVQSYWTPIWDQYPGNHASQTSINQFYTENSSYFVTNYAATNPVEDMAEVFAFYNLGNKPVDTTKVANKKILQLYERSEVNALREQIRKGSGRNLKRTLRSTDKGFPMQRAGKGCVRRKQ